MGILTSIKRALMPEDYADLVRRVEALEAANKTLPSTYVSKTNHNLHSHQYARSAQPWEPGMTEPPSVKA